MVVIYHHITLKGTERLEANHPSSSLQIPLSPSPPSIPSPCTKCFLFPSFIPNARNIFSFQSKCTAVSCIQRDRRDSLYRTRSRSILRSVLSVLRCGCTVQLWQHHTHMLRMYICTHRCVVQILPCILKYLMYAHTHLGNVKLSQM